MDEELNLTNIVNNLVEDILETLDVENQIIQELLLEDDEDLGNDDADRDIFNLGNLHVDRENVHEVLAAAIGNIMQLEEAEEFLLENDAEVPEGQLIVYVDINGFRTLGDPAFQQHFRMNRELFETLLLLFGNHLVVTNRLLRLRTGLDICLLMSLWVLGNLSTFRTTGSVFGVSKVVVHYHYLIVIEALRELAGRFIKWPTAAGRARNKNACQRRAGFWGVVGMMDGSLMKVTAPAIQREEYFDRHHSYSINIHAVCDHKLVFTHVYLGESGRVHDSRVFLRSPLYDILLENNEALGQDGHILADSAYTLTDKVLVPYRNNGNQQPRMRRFNYFLSSLRMCIERAFGHLKEKFRRLYRLQVRNFDYGIDHIMASLMLHNFIKLEGLEPDGMEFPAPNHNDDAAYGGRVHPLLAAARAAGERKRNAIALQLTPD